MKRPRGIISHSNLISYFAIEFLPIQCYHHHDDAISDEEKGDLQTLMKTAFSLHFATMMTSFEIKSFQLISKENPLQADKFSLQLL